MNLSRLRQYGKIYVAERIPRGRAKLSTIAFALAVVFSFSHHTVYSVYLPLSWFCLGVGFLLSPSWSVGPKWIFLCLLIILGSMALAIPGNILLGDGDWAENASFFLIITPFLSLYLANLNKSIFGWIAIGFLFHSAIVLWYGIHGGYNLTGLAINPNPSGGAMALTALWLVSGPFKWLAVLPVAAIAFTASRWAMATLGIALVAMATIRFLPWRWAVPMLALEILVAVFVTFFVASEYSATSQAVSDAESDTLYRLHISSPLNILPIGSYRTDDMHNVPIRMSVELGILSALAWIAVTAYGLIRRPHFDVTWWLLAAIAMLSMMDYYTLYGALAACWWLLIGLRSKMVQTL